MPHSARRTRLAAVLLASTLLCLPLPAAAQTKGSEPLSSRAFFTLFVDFLGLRPVMAALGLDNGCQMDPNGFCLSQAQDLDNGCQMDPSGQCLRQLTLDNGCKMDPDGQPLASCVVDQ